MTRVQALAPLQLFALAILLHSCSRPPTDPEMPTATSINGVRQQVQRLAPGSRILVICGGSAGQAFYLRPQPQGWVDDPVTEGRIALVRYDDGVIDLIFRGATDVYYSARQDGGDVRLTYGENSAREYGVMVSYQSTGVTETYHFLSDPRGGRIALWTSNKPGGAAGVTKVGSYVARCI